MIRTCSFLSLITAVAFSLHAQKGYEIQVQIKGLHDTLVVLGHHFGNATSIYPDDTARLDKNGKGVFKKKKDLPGGMYVIFLPQKGTYFDIIINHEYRFSVENDTADLFANIKFKNSKENEVFYSYQRFLSAQRNQINRLNEEYKKTSDPDEKARLRKEMEAIDKKVGATIDSIQKTYPSLFVSKFIKATRNIEVPEPPKGPDGKIDSTFQYRYFRAHYFDNFDISDPRLLRTPLYENKIMTYIEKVIPQIPDSIYPELDKLIEKSRTSPELFRYMLVTLFNYYGKSQIMGFDAVQIYLAEKYYIPEATWSDSSYINKLKDYVKKNKPLIIGAVAPDVRLVVVPSNHFIEAQKDTALRRYPHVGQFVDLHAIKSDYLVLFFWDPECGHCKKAAPQMHALTNKLKQKGVLVLAVGTVFGETGKIKWVDFINQHGLYDWINAWNPYDYEYKIKYNIESTPQIFILNRDKKIQGKRIGPEQVEEIIDMLIKRDEYLKKHPEEKK